MRRTTSLSALLLGATLLAPTEAATAVGETCRGEAATIVGTGPTVQGTDGRDVIVTGVSWRVSAGAGDDLVCVTGALGQSNVLTVDAGSGNDAVDSTAMQTGFYLTAILGDGADTFVGGVAGDTVIAGTRLDDYSIPSEAEKDLIDTGEGSDHVWSGGPGLANDDVVRTGAGEDGVTWSGTMGAQSVLDGGADDRDTLVVGASGQTFRVDLAAKTLSRNGAPEASFSAFEDFQVAPEPDLGSVEILGSAGRDVVLVRSAATVMTDLGDGSDSLSLGLLKPGGQINLGAGTDTVSVRSPDGSAEVDLAAGTLAVDGSASHLAGAENAYASAREVSLVGDGQANFLNAVGCFATIDGRSGDDGISHGNYDFDADAGYDCTKGTVKLRGGSGQDEISGGKRADRIYGGGGNDRIKTGPARQGRNEAWGGGGNDKIQGGGDKDVLSGGAGNDVLGGKSGRDVAIGGADRDRCRAEVEKSCER